jgi:cAMP-binding proteins - catabolite gene activator and regulatory subunit of cAMP-dependent protein kinases
MKKLNYSGASHFSPRLSLPNSSYWPSTSQRLTYKPGDVLFRQGDPGDAAFVIIGGEADVTVDTPGGPLTVARLKQNDFVGEIAILCDVPRTATVAAATEVTTLRIEKICSSA